MKLIGIIAAALGILAPQFEIPDWDNSVTFEVVASQQPVRPGDAFEVALVAEIVDGYHLYGPEEIEPSRTAVEVSGEGLEPGDVSYPKPLRRELSGLGEYDLYEGRIAIRVPVKLAKTANGSEHQAVVTVNYQVCTDVACSAPTSDELTLTMPGAAAGAEIKALHADIFTSN